MPLPLPPLECDAPNKKPASSPWKAPPAAAQPASKPKEKVDYSNDAVPLSGVAEINGKSIYFLKIAMGDTGYSGFAQFVHDQQFTEDEFRKIVEEATQITNEVRIAKRRAQMEKNRVPITNPFQTNEEYFQTDIQFFEGVMCDKWDFRILVTSGHQTTLEPTIPGVK